MEHYYSKEQKSPLNLKKIIQRISGREFEFYTASGIFSKDKVDKGTLILAENMIVDKNSKVLDIGCGIGILGIVAAKMFDAKVVMGDINRRAVMLAKKNVRLNNMNAEIYQGNLYEKIKDNDFDAILSNPPQTAGKELCFKLIGDSKIHLESSLKPQQCHLNRGNEYSQELHHYLRQDTP